MPESSNSSSVLVLVSRDFGLPKYSSSERVCIWQLFHLLSTAIIQELVGVDSKVWRRRRGQGAVYNLMIKSQYVSGPVSLHKCFSGGSFLPPFDLSSIPSDVPKHLLYVLTSVD